MLAGPFSSTLSSGFTHLLLPEVNETPLFPSNADFNPMNETASR
jgi:hypothetical protein